MSVPARLGYFLALAALTAFLAIRLRACALRQDIADLFRRADLEPPAWMRGPTSAQYEHFMTAPER